MPQPLIRSFESFSDAEQAREALMAAGFGGRVELSVRDDEAGPVEGNFMAGNGRIATASGEGARQPLMAAGDDIYHRNFRYVAHRGVNLLVVQAEEGDEQQRARAILDRYGAVDIDPLSARKGAGS